MPKSLRSPLRRAAAALRALLALLAVLVAGRARAQESAPPAAPSPASTRYPLALSVTSSDSARQATYEHPEHGLFGAPLNPESTSRVGAMALASLRAIGARIFTDGAPARLTLQVIQVTPSLKPEPGGWLASVEEVLVVRDGAGAALGQWKVGARDRIDGQGASAIPAAFERAAALAAQRFEAAFEEKGGVRAWLDQQGIQLGKVARRAAGVERPPLPEPIAPGVPRTAPALYVDAGPGLVPVSFADSQQSGFTQTKSAAALHLRVGLAGRWYFAQLAIGRWASSMSVSPDAPASFDVTQWALGADAGLQLQFGGLLDLAAGMGARWIHERIDHGTSADGSPPFWIEGTRLAPSALLALRMTPEVGALHGHARLSIEGRHSFSTGDYTLIQDQQVGRRSLSLSAENTVALLFGGEWSAW